MRGYADYDGLIVTTIKLEELPDGKTIEDLVDGDRVVFNEQDGNESSKVYFLKDIKQQRDRSGKASYRVYDATYVSPTKAAEIANAGYGNFFGKKSTPLFFVHGFSVEPGYVLQELMPRALERLGKEKIHYPIPVIWPVNGSLLGYNTDQEKYTLDAGANLKVLVNDLSNDLFPKKSLMCHSMGNHLVFNGVCGVGLPDNPGGPPGDAPDVKWENIFLVAADIPNDVFAENPDPGEFGHKKKKAENMKAMLVEGGKIFVIHHEGDRALQGSVALNWGERLGRLGPSDIRQDFKETIVTIDAKPYSEADDEADDWKMHSYQLETWACDIYNNAGETAGAKTPESQTGCYIS